MNYLAQEEDFSQQDFDKMHHSPVPEPAFTGLAFIGICLLIMIWSRKRK